MTNVTKPPGIEATIEPTDWAPAGQPDDPDEIMAGIVDPARRGELYPLCRRLREVAPVHRNRPGVLSGAWTFTRFAEADVVFRNPRVVNDPQVIEEAFSHGDGTFTGIMRDVMLWQ